MEFSEQALRKLKFCPVCGNPLEVHYNIDIGVDDGAACRSCDIFIEVHSTYPGLRTAVLKFNLDEV